jgi:hypothetical protein
MFDLWKKPLDFACCMFYNTDMVKQTANTEAKVMAKTTKCGYECCKAQSNYELWHSATPVLGSSCVGHLAENIALYPQGCYVRQMGTQKVNWCSRVNNKAATLVGVAHLISTHTTKQMQELLVVQEQAKEDTARAQALSGAKKMHRRSPTEEGGAAGRAGARAQRRADFLERRQRMAITRSKLVQHIAKVVEELQDLAAAAELQAMDNENDEPLGSAWEQVDFAWEVAIPKLRLAQEVLQQANKNEAPKVSK